MKRSPAIYGIGWIDGSAEDRTEEVTFTYVGIREDDAAGDVLAEITGYANSSGSYELDHDGLEIVLGRAADSDAAAVLQEMADEDGGEMVVVFADEAMETTDGADGANQHVQRLRAVADSGRHEVSYGEAHWWPTDNSATDPYPLIDAWAKRWPDSLPIAHELKELFEDEWVRFHSLPGSRRSAETEADWASVLQRHNTVLGELLTDGEEMLVIISEIAGAPAPIDPDIDFWTAVPWHYADPDLLYAHLYATTEQWSPGDLDELLRLAADEQVLGVIIAPMDLDWLYHPYSGGADVILPSKATRDALAERHADWLSPHPSGL